MNTAKFKKGQFVLCWIDSQWQKRKVLATGQGVNKNAYIVRHHGTQNGYIYENEMKPLTK